MAAVTAGPTARGAARPRRTLWRDRRRALGGLALHRAVVGVPMLAGLSGLVFLLADRSPSTRSPPTWARATSRSPPNSGSR
ncbi:hypothetical protein HFP72_06175 [Nocardiopsis sp. ARC36]